MGLVVSFIGYTPPARFDVPPVSWTDVQIEEAATPAGAWTVIDTITFAVPDADPENPAARSFTTENGTAPSLWYRLTFIDGNGDVSNPSSPVQKNAATRDLCTLADVTSYVPAYRANDTTDAKLADLITSESELITRESGREIISVDDGPASRSFTITQDAVLMRAVEIGDLASAGDSDFALELLSAADEVVATVDRDHVRPRYNRTRRRHATQSWHPVTALEVVQTLGAPVLSRGQTLVVTGNWGFPAVPAFIKEACAKRVILRYVTEVAGSGDAFSEAVSQLNFSGLFASARDAVAEISGGVMIA